MNSIKIAFLGALLLAPLAACSSIESTHLVRDQYGVMKGEKFDGVPILITIPDRIGFVVTESYYQVTREIDGETEGSIQKISTKEKVVTIGDKPIYLGPTELFTLDTKRPISGSAKGSIKLTNNYPTDISNDVQDTTIKDVGDVLEKAKKFVEEAGATDNDPDAKRVLLSQSQYLLVYDPRTYTFQKL